MKKRICELDMVKGLVILFVVLRHVLELTGVNLYGKGLFSFFNAGCECIMFLFILISGYVFKSKGSAALDIKNKVKQLLVPYLLYTAFFSLTYFIRYILLGDMSLEQFAVNTIGNFLADPSLDLIHWTTQTNIMEYAFVPYWYVAEIFMAFILFIPINKALEKRNTAWKISAVVMMLSITALLIYLDPGQVIATNYTSGVSYFVILPNIIGFAAILMIGTLLHQAQIFDMEAHSGKFTGILFAISFIVTTISFALYSNPQYALQFGKWGPYGAWSVIITPLSSFTLTYTLIYICCFLKKIKPVKTVFSWLGANTLDILMTHFGIAELLCMIFGIWYSVYFVTYPEEAFSWWYVLLIISLTFICVILYSIVKNKIKNCRKTHRPA